MLPNKTRDMGLDNMSFKNPNKEPEVNTALLKFVSNNGESIIPNTSGPRG